MECERGIKHGFISHKRAGRGFLSAGWEEFRQVLDRLKLTDVPLSGRQWSDMREDACFSQID